MFFTSLKKCLVFLTSFPLEAGVSLLTIVARSFHFFWRSVLVPSVFRSRSFHCGWQSRRRPGWICSTVVNLLDL